MSSSAAKTKFKAGGRFCISTSHHYPEQQKIAKILTSVDEVMETTETQINKLKDLKKGMMNELLTKGIGHTEFRGFGCGVGFLRVKECTIAEFINENCIVF